jgi:DNA-directed RNA polymerase specialized sigma24 family protein
LGLSVASDAFHVLLERLAVTDAGGLGYERLRSRLVAFFRYRFAAQAEALADQALDRLARRLSDGTPVESLESYALGIARLLVLEEENRQRKERLGAVEAARHLELHRVDGEADAAIPALRACLASLGEEGASFILDYYGAEDGAGRIERRQRMAAASGLTLNALRNRALRMRLSLEKCVRGRLQESRHRPAGRDTTAVSDTVVTMEGDAAS